MPKTNLTETERVRVEIRVPKKLHKAITRAAAQAGVPTATWATMVLGLAAGELPDLVHAIEIWGPDVIKVVRKRRRAS